MNVRRRNVGQQEPTVDVNAAPNNVNNNVEETDSGDEGDTGEYIIGSIIVLQSVVWLIIPPNMATRTSFVKINFVIFNAFESFKT